MEGAGRHRHLWDSQLQSQGADCQQVPLHKVFLAAMQGTRSAAAPSRLWQFKGPSVLDSC